MELINCVMLVPFKSSGQNSFLDGGCSALETVQMGRLKLLGNNEDFTSILALL